VRNRHSFSTANIPSSNQKYWTTTTSHVIRKTPKISQLEHKKTENRTGYLCTHLQTREKCLKKKTWPFIPCRLPPTPPVVAGGAHSGNFLAFAGGWFKSQLGYLRTFSVSRIVSTFLPSRTLRICVSIPPYPPNRIQ
jgi:hypothetical protein